MTALFVEFKNMYGCSLHKRKGSGIKQLQNLCTLQGVNTK